MKALTILAAIAMTSSSAMAMDTTMGLKGRFDYVNTTGKTTPQTGAVTKSSSGILTTSYFRLVTDAKLNETTKAKLTLDFAKAQAAPDAAGNVSSFVNEAFITKTLGDLSVMVGKQAVLVGGRENDFSGRDMYIASNFNDQVSGNLTGVTAGYSVAGQDVYLQYLQQSSSAQNGDVQYTDKKVVGLAYYGAFMDKMIMPIASYHKSGTGRNGQYDTHTAVGVRVNVANFIVEADYLMLKQEKLSAAGDAELNSMVAHVRYVMEGFQPFAKYIKDEGKKGYTGIVDGSTTSERTAWELGLEFVPNKDEDMRYHVVYNNSEKKKLTAAPTSKVEESKIFAGVAFSYNILK